MHNVLCKVYIVVCVKSISTNQTLQIMFICVFFFYMYQLCWFTRHTTFMIYNRCYAVSKNIDYDMILILSIFARDTLRIIHCDMLWYGILLRTTVLIYRAQVLVFGNFIIIRQGPVLVLATKILSWMHAIYIFTCSYIIGYLGLLPSVCACHLHVATVEQEQEQ